MEKHIEREVAKVTNPPYPVQSYAGRLTSHNILGKAGRGYLERSRVPSKDTTTIELFFHAHEQMDPPDS